MDLKTAGLVSLGSLALGLAFLLGSTLEGPVIVNEQGTPIQTRTPTRVPYRTTIPFRSPTPKKFAYAWYSSDINPNDPGDACSVAIYGRNVDVFGPNNNPNPDEDELVREGYANIIMPAGEGWRYKVDGAPETMECLRQITGINEDGERTYGGVFGLAETEEPMNIAPKKDHERELGDRLDGILISRGQNPERFGGKDRQNHGHGRRA